MTIHQFLAAHFMTDKFVRVNPNGQDPKTGKFETPGCWIKADNFIQAINEINKYTETGNRRNIVFDSEVNSINFLNL